jgi:hypothetical protein
MGQPLVKSLARERLRKRGNPIMDNKRLRPSSVIALIVTAFGIIVTRETVISPTVVGLSKPLFMTELLSRNSCNPFKNFTLGISAEQSGKIPYPTVIAPPGRSYSECPNDSPVDFCGLRHETRGCELPCLELRRIRARSRLAITPTCSPLWADPPAWVRRLHSANLMSLTATETLNREFLEIRCRILDLAAMLDRLERADDTVADDPRLKRIHEALDVLKKVPNDRAEQVQLTFSRPYDEGWQQALKVKPR